jgi:hypothetical protein
VTALLAKLLNSYVKWHSMHFVPDSDAVEPCELLVAHGQTAGAG